MYFFLLSIEQEKQNKTSLFLTASLFCALCSAVYARTPVAVSFPGGISCTFIYVDSIFPTYKIRKRSRLKRDTLVV